MGPIRRIVLVASRDGQDPLLSYVRRRATRRSFDDLNVQTNFEGNEERQLDGTNMDGSPAPWEDHRWWIRIPSSAMRRTFIGIIFGLKKLEFDTALHILLVLVPLGIASAALRWKPSTVFTLNYFALLAIEALLSSYIEKVWFIFGNTAEVVLDVLLPNLFPLIIGVAAILCNETRIVQSFIIGNVLSNILLGFGSSTIAGGWFGGEQAFNGTVFSTVSSFTILLGPPFAIPIMFSMVDAKTGGHSSESITIFSHGAAVVLLMLYLLWLLFKRTHSYIWDEEVAELEPQHNYSNHPLMDSALLISGIAVVILASCAAVCTRALMLSIDEVIKASHITRALIGVILLPGIINLSSYAKTIAIASRGETDLALHLTLETSIENTYLTLPLLVLIGWAIGHPMLLDFQFLESVILFVSILLTSAMVAKGKTNYIEGAMCVGLYLIIVLTFVLYPDKNGQSDKQ